MKFLERGLHARFLIIILSGFLVIPSVTYGAVLYKSYVIRQDKGQDILCDPYIVQKDDYVLKLFRQRGEISHSDFPEFLDIFERINPHISDINTIRLDQQLLIPLKKIGPDAYPDQASGIVNIPFITISSISEFLRNQSDEYIVKKGECISVIISREYGPYGTQAYKEGIKLFKAINPDIADLNRIYSGQVLNIPHASLRSEPWFQSLFDSSGEVIKGDGQASMPKEPSVPELSERSDHEVNLESSFSEAAAAMDGKLMDKGIYYFPRPGKDDLRLDLARHPVIEFKDGKKILFINKDQMLKDAHKILKSYWQNLEVVKVPRKASVEQVIQSVYQIKKKDGDEDRLFFTDFGVVVEVRAKCIFDKPSAVGMADNKVCISFIQNWSERTPESLCRYLEKNGIIIKDVLKENITSSQVTRKIPRQYSDDIITIDFSDREAFVSELITAMGCNYQQNTSITFPYAGIQVETVSNLISTGHGKEILVSFDDLYGDAVAAIEKTGIGVLQIEEEDSQPEIIQKLLNAIGISFVIDPTFMGAKRSAEYNTFITIPGYLVKSAEEKEMLLAAAPLNREIIIFLKSRGIEIIMIGLPEEYHEAKPMQTENELTRSMDSERGEK